MSPCIKDVTEEWAIVSQIFTVEIGVILKGSSKAFQLPMVIHRDGSILHVPTNVDHLQPDFLLIVRL